MIKIRKATINDLESASDMYIKLLESVNKFEKDMHTKDKRGLKKEIVEELGNKDITFILATDNNKVVGCLQGSICKAPCYNHYKKLSNINWIFIEKKYRKQGLAQKLIAQFISILKKKNVSVFYTDVHVKNKASISLNKKLGFKEYHTEFRKEIK